MALIKFGIAYDILVLNIARAFGLDSEKVFEFVTFLDTAKNDNEVQKKYIEIMGEWNKMGDFSPISPTLSIYPLKCWHPQHFQPPSQSVGLGFVKNLTIKKIEKRVDK